MKKANTTTLIINAEFFRLRPVNGIYLSVSSHASSPLQIVIESKFFIFKI
jgi:hypothetical protein